MLFVTLLNFSELLQNQISSTAQILSSKDDYDDSFGSLCLYIRYFV